MARKRSADPELVRLPPPKLTVPWKIPVKYILSFKSTETEKPTSAKVAPKLWLQAWVPGVTTVTEEVAVLAPSTVVAVMVAAPTARAVTRPVLSTAAIAGADDVHCIRLSVASEGIRVAVS